ncbi:hypothetical protein [Photobacterium profundum]|uniref:hypothetical protein n=1 Tax=Photobacterium profundum TaxID=74109 RepID=UPI00059BC11D|nr:hypothetical protein [Photobacterium profundum]
MKKANQKRIWTEPCYKLQAVSTLQITFGIPNRNTPSLRQAELVITFGQKFFSSIANFPNHGLARVWQPTLAKGKT